MKPLILASTSPYRREQLQRLGIPFEGIPPECDEDAFKNQGLELKELASTLATEKAASLVKSHPDSIIIGGDQIAAIDGEILSKPLSRENAYKQLDKLQGSTHQLITSLSIISGNDIYSHTEVANLTMVPLNFEQIEKYVERDLPLYCCGSYKIEGHGISLFEKIEVDDFTSIVGMPMLFLSKTLRELGHQIP